MQWIAKSVHQEQIDALAAELRSTPELRLNGDACFVSTLARLLHMRGIQDAASAQRYLAPQLADLHSPYLMAGMKAAIERLDAAIERKEGILIYGDYDVDGTTAIVILKTAIELCGGTADFHVPHRIREGYGMKDDVIERAAVEGIRGRDRVPWSMSRQVRAERRPRPTSQASAKSAPSSSAAISRSPSASSPSWWC